MSDINRFDSKFLRLMQPGIACLSKRTRKGGTVLPRQMYTKKSGRIMSAPSSRGVAKYSICPPNVNRRLSHPPDTNVQRGNDNNRSTQYLRSFVPKTKASLLQLTKLQSAFSGVVRDRPHRVSGPSPICRRQYTTKIVLYATGERLIFQQAELYA